MPHELAAPIQGQWHSLHEVKGAVGWDKRDCPVILEPCQAHTLVELHVFKVHGLLPAGPPLRLEQHLLAAQEESIQFLAKVMAAA